MILDMHIMMLNTLNKHFMELIRMAIPIVPTDKYISYKQTAIVCSRLNIVSLGSLISKARNRYLQQLLFRKENTSLFHRTIGNLEPPPSFWKLKWNINAETDHSSKSCNVKWSGLVSVTLLFCSFVSGIIIFSLHSFYKISVLTFFNKTLYVPVVSFLHW